MIKATVNGKKEFTIEGNLLDGTPVEWDIIEPEKNVFHILRGNKGYKVLLVSFNTEEKTLVVNVNGNNYDISIKDKYDLLLKQLGIKQGSTAGAQHIKAPMPGLIIQVGVSEGSEVEKGEALLILEAMKMENVIKSPRAGKIKKVHVQLRSAVEKNQVMVEFES